MNEFTQSTYYSGANSFQSGIRISLLGQHEQATATATATVKGTGRFISLGNVNVSVVPEPASLALLLGGLALVAGIARRRAA